MRWKTISSRITLQNDFFSIEEDRCQKSDGTIVENYYTIHRPEVAVIIAFTKKQELVMTRQYRHPVKDIDIELPAGYIEKKEKIMEAAKRELLEETGHSVKKLEKIFENYASAGLMSTVINFFIGFDAKKIQEPTPDKNEELELYITPWKKALKLLEEGQIKDMASVTGILLAKNYIKKHKIFH